MATELEDLRILKITEEIADTIWKQVVAWDEFAQAVVGKQLARAVDSIGANIAESYGRFNYGEKLQFLYYSRGSLFETKYWLNRARVRELIPEASVKVYAARLSDVARQLNALANSLKAQRKGIDTRPKSIRDPGVEYIVNDWIDDSTSLFRAIELNWLES